jgi:hypothetical protein
MKKLLLWLALIIGGIAAATLAIMHYPPAKAAAQRAVIPGALSQPHAFLENNCAACHTPVKGVEAKNCVVCHADNQTVLQRQPSAFHGEISECAACHREHQGRVPSTTKMDHAALARIGFKQLKSDPQRAGADMAKLKRWIEDSAAPQSALAHLRPAEALLNCATCHQTKDRHRGLFGNDCAQCHATAKWTLAEYRHPSSVSQSCAQCHQAPPSHYMMHFQMISMKVACQPNAKVNQCFLCHQTTSWNDIKGVGYYKHH